MTRRGFAAPFILIGVLVLLLALGGAYYLGKSSPSSPTLPQPTTTIPLSPTADPTSNWKTYKNTKLNYSIKYPTDFNIVKGPADNLPDSAFQDLDNISFESANRGRFDVSINPKDASGKQIQCDTDAECLQKWLDVLKITPPDEVISKISIKILGKNREGFENIIKNKFYTQGFDYYVFIEKGNIWNIGLPGQAEQKKTNSEEIFDQILSTFKFTN